MPAFRKHYREIILLTLIFTLLGSWSYIPHLLGPSTEAQTAPPPEEEPAAVTVVDEPMRQVIDQVRQSLALGNNDLAAMGLTESAATNVLTAVRSWCEQNDANLKQAEQDIRSAEKSLREAIRRVRMGPRNDAILAQLPILTSQLAAEQDRRPQLIESLIPQIESLLSFEQQAVWLTARRNHDAPARYRYAPDLNAVQKQVLDVAVRKYGPGSQRVAALEDETIWSTQKLALSNTQTAALANIETIAKAEETALPRETDAAE